MKTLFSKTAQKALILTLMSIAAFSSANNTHAQGALPAYENEVPIPSALVWQNAEGKSVSIDDYKGKVILLNLWATWCGPCVFEMPIFNFLQNRYSSSGFEVVAISGDDTAEEIANFYKKNNVDTLNIYTDPVKIFQKAFNVKNLPATFLINREGHIIAGSEGLTEWLGEAFTQQLQNTLKQSYTEQAEDDVEVIEGSITQGLHR